MKVMTFRMSSSSLMFVVSNIALALARVWGGGGGRTWICFATRVVSVTDVSAEYTV